MEFRPGHAGDYDRYSIPLINRVAAQGVGDAGAASGRAGAAGRFTAVVDRVKKGFDEIERVTNEAAENIELFRPFIFENSYVFRADNIRALRDRMPRRRSGAPGAGARRRSTSTTTG